MTLTSISIELVAMYYFLHNPAICRMYYNHDMTDKGKIALRTAVIERDSSLCELKFAV